MKVGGEIRTKGNAALGPAYRRRNLRHNNGNVDNVNGRYSSISLGVYSDFEGIVEESRYRFCVQLKQGADADPILW